MITFFIKKNEDDTILVKKVLKSLDQIPSVLIEYLSSLNCHTEVVIDPENKDFYYWVEKTSDSSELFFD